MYCVCLGCRKRYQPDQLPRPNSMNQWRCNCGGLIQTVACEKHMAPTPIGPNLTASGGIKAIRRAGQRKGAGPLKGTT